MQDGRALAQWGPRLTGLTLATTHGHSSQPAGCPVAAELRGWGLRILAAQPPGPHGPGWARASVLVLQPGDREE